MAELDEARRIRGEEWQSYWPQISQDLDRIAMYWSDYWTKDFIYNSVVNEFWQAWGFGKKGYVEMLVFTQIIDYPAGRVLQIPLAYGNHLDRLLPTIEAGLERFASVTECRICEIVGRVGWERKLKMFKRRAVVLRAKVPEKVMEVH